MSDISWDADPETALRQFRKGEEVDAVILSIDAEKERISLGIKQLASDPFSEYLTAHPKGSIVSAPVKSVDARGAVIDLADGIEGYLKASEISAERVDDASCVLSVGETVEAKITGVDRRNRAINLSVRAKDQADEKEALNAVRSSNQDVEVAGPSDHHRRPDQAAAGQPERLSDSLDPSSRHETPAQPGFSFIWLGTFGSGHLLARRGYPSPSARSSSRNVSTS